MVQDTSVASGKLFSHSFAQWLQYKRSGPSWDLSETRSSLVSCVVRKNTLQLPLVYRPLSAMWKTWRLPTSQQVLSSSPFQSVFSSSSYKRTLFQDLQVVATRDNLSPPPFFILYSSKIKFKPRQLRLAVDICNWLRQSYLQPQSSALSNLRLAS